jgi:1,4-dihydroxy-2-naphthoyl-CoA hydrolase
MAGQSDGVIRDIKGTLPDLLGIEILIPEPGRATGRFEIKPHHLAPNGFLHAASIVALLDSACGIGCFHNRPEGASGFTTIELKSNHLGTARDGVLSCEARLVHGGRSTQVWDAEAKHDATGKTIALFRCTQMILYPKS